MFLLHFISLTQYSNEKFTKYFFLLDIFHLFAGEREDDWNKWITVSAFENFEVLWLDVRSFDIRSFVAKRCYISANLDCHHHILVVYAVWNTGRNNNAIEDPASFFFVSVFWETSLLHLWRRKLNTVKITNSAKMNVIMSFSIFRITLCISPFH